MRSLWVCSGNRAFAFGWWELRGRLQRPFGRRWPLVFFCFVGVSGLIFCQMWQCSRGRIGHRCRQGSEDRAGGGHGRFWRLVAGLASL